MVSFLYDGLISFPFFPFFLVIYILFIWDLRMSTLPAITRTVATRFHYPNEISSPAFFFLYLGVFVVQMWMWSINKIVGENENEEK